MSDSRLPFQNEKPASELTLVELAEQLEKVTGWIENERVREREARALYEQVAKQVEANVKGIREYAESLLNAQRRKTSAFDTMFGKAAAAPAPARSSGFQPKSALGREPKNLADAIISIWMLEQYAEPLTTEDIAEALKDVGYRSDAAPTSLRSSINQALAKLCRVGRIIRFRADGSRIDPKDNSSRARKYLAAIRLPEPV